MVYKKLVAESAGSGGYVVCILIDGKVMPERSDGVVEVPFDTDYVIRLRNKTGHKAVAKVYIDEDECVTPSGLIINSHDYVDLDCHTERRTKFRFVSVDSSEAVSHGKNRPYDPSMGVVKVEFFKEKKYEAPPVIINWTNPQWVETPTWTMNNSLSVTCSNAVGTEEKTCGTILSRNVSAGATVDGGQSNQQFTHQYLAVDWSAPTVLKVVLKGYEVTSDYVIASAVRYCTNCGTKKSRPSARFCELCGKKLLEQV